MSSERSLEHLEDLTEDTLYKGMTRPARVLGVTIDALVVSIVITALTMAITGKLLFLLVFLVIWGLCYLVELREPRMFRILMISMRLKVRCPRVVRKFWTGSTRCPRSVSVGRQFD